MAEERRFQTGFRTVDRDDPGLIQEDDGTVWLVNPDGTRTQLPGGGGGGGCAYFSCDTGAGVATVDPPNSLVAESQGVLLSGVAEAGGNAPHVGAQASLEGDEPRASYEVGITGADDESAYVTMAANDPTGDRSATLRISASEADGAAIELVSTQLVRSLAPQVLVVGQAAEVGQAADVYAAVQNPTGETRGGIESVLSGDENENVETTILASNGLGDGNDAATITLHSIVGGGGSFQLRGDRLSFSAEATPIERPTFDLSSGTLPQLAQILADLGLINVVA